ncbi:MAG: glucose-1-phosphate cytidylyltransferase, partial [Limisphaerales bacterium]
AAGQVKEFNEKPQVTEGRINGGFFVANREIFNQLENCETVMFEQQPIRTLASNGQVMAFNHDAFWQPMDTFSEYTLLNKLWADGKAPWKTWK